MLTSFLWLLTIPFITDHSKEAFFSAFDPIFHFTGLSSPQPDLDSMIQQQQREADKKMLEARKSLQLSNAQVTCRGVF